MNGAEKRAAVLEFMVDMNPEAVFMEGLDDAIVGWATQQHAPPLVVYDFDRIIAILVAEGSTEEEARDHFGFNIEGLWAGEGTPLILYTLEGGSVFLSGVPDVPEPDGPEGLGDVQAVRDAEPRLGTL